MELRTIIILSLFLTPLSLNADVFKIREHYDDNTCYKEAFEGYVVEFDGSTFTILREQTACGDSMREACADYRVKDMSRIMEFVSPTVGIDYYLHTIHADRIKSIVISDQYLETCIPAKQTKPTQFFNPKAVSFPNKLNLYQTKVMEDIAEKLGTEGVIAQGKFQPTEDGWTTVEAQNGTSLEFQDFESTSGPIETGKQVLVPFETLEHQDGISKFVLMEGHLEAENNDISSVELRGLWSVDYDTSESAVLSWEKIGEADIKLGKTTSLSSEKCLPQGQAEWNILEEEGLKDVSIHLEEIVITSNERTMKITPTSAPECDFVRPVVKKTTIYK